MRTAHAVLLHDYYIGTNESGNNKGDGDCVATNYIVITIIIIK